MMVAFACDLTYLNDWILRVGHDFAQVPEQKVIVLLEESFHAVRYVAGVVHQSEFLVKSQEFVILF